MIKVLLVDDESIEREGIKLMLGRNRSNFKVVGEASTGKQAVQLAAKLKPDLIFMDIKMPVMDGVVAVKKILSENHAPKCIMVSAYNTFEYAREVMKYGVKEYLLKPSKATEVLKAYDRMAEEIEAERQKAGEQLEMKRRIDRVASLVEVDLILSLMMDHIHEFRKEDWSDWFDIEGKRGYVAVFSFDTKEQLPGYSEKSSLYQTLKHILSNRHENVLVGPLIGHHVPAFIFMEHEADGLLEPRQGFLSAVIHTFQKRHPACSLLAGAGTSVENINQFTVSYEKAIHALESVYANPTANYMAYYTELKQKQTKLLLIEKEKALLTAIKNGDRQESARLFDSYLQAIDECSHHQLLVTRVYLEDFFRLLTRQLYELGLNEDFQYSFHLLETPLQVKEYAKVHLSSILERIAQWRSTDLNGLLLEAKDYMDRHYSKAISLEEVAEKAGVSSYYLSKLFKERFKITFIDYLTSLRIRKAKDYLLNPSLSLKEIAFDVGYKDPNYFSRVFKKETGLSPSEFRLKGKQ
ncbi:response regulator [Bacillus sp. FJAT-27251]|uniref:response regulator n=1 Tax=Bacillus sp. FJAT-27251 TaxID=1684142 RepID=UPI0006A778CE|nr:response regulator [Bacillus sp. FJAT-27251]